MSGERPYGPLWQLEQNAKSKRQAAEAFRRDAAKATDNAIKADADAEEYEAAAAILRDAKAGVQP